MSKETNRKVIDTTPNDLPAFVRLTDIPNKGTTLILQRYLLTKVETIINRDEALAVTQALVEHFRFMPKEVAGGLMQVEPAFRFFVVTGPQGCGKTCHKDIIQKHFNADMVIDDEANYMWSSLNEVSRTKARRVVVLTHKNGKDLDHLSRGFGPKVEVEIYRYRDVMRLIQNSCSHTWVRTAGAQNESGACQVDFMKCSHCGAEKDL